MRHRVKKIKINKGKDHTKSVVRKLLINFLEKGKIETTLKRAKILKSEVERLVSKAKKGTQAGYNVILSKLGSKKWVNYLVQKVAPVFEKRTGGYVRVKRTRVRQGDASIMAKVEWVDPIVKEEKEKSKAKSKSDKKKTAKVKKASEQEEKNKNSKAKTKK